jgi:hypothetical protein
MERWMNRFDPGRIHKGRKSRKFVISAKGGMPSIEDVLAAGFRRGDGPFDFLRDHQFGFIRSLEGFLKDFRKDCPGETGGMKAHFPGGDARTGADGFYEKV